MGKSPKKSCKGKLRGKKRHPYKASSPEENSCIDVSNFFPQEKKIYVRDFAQKSSCVENLNKKWQLVNSTSPITFLMVPVRPLTHVLFCFVLFQSAKALDDFADGIKVNLYLFLTFPGVSVSFMLYLLHLPYEHLSSVLENSL